MYNTGSDVLGVLIARASGQPLEMFLRERIFEPLNMRDTSFSVPEASLDRLPRENMIIILMTPSFLAPPNPPNVAFWTLAYQAIDD